jgi:signal transduction histidine kinase
VGGTGGTGGGGGTGGVGSTGGGGTGGAGSSLEGFGGAGGGAAGAAGDAADVVVDVPTGITNSYDDSLTLALTISAIVGIVLAIILATWITRRILRGLSTMQVATGRLAAGDYEQHIPEPAEAELADLARSIHELRNPLATIEGYMEGLIDGVLPATTDTYSTIAAEAHRLQRLTADLSLLSQAQEGALNLQLREIDVGTVAQAVADRLRPQFQSKGVRLTIDVAEPLPIAGDGDRLTQALINIVGNALTHTPAGGAVAITGAFASGQAHLAVVDSGAGIPPEQLEAIFDRFTRLDANASGTGIGLNIARTIARHHGGSLTAHSEGPGTGTTMTLVLPGRGGSAA